MGSEVRQLVRAECDTALPSLRTRTRWSGAMKCRHFFNHFGLCPWGADISATTRNSLLLPGRHVAPPRFCEVVPILIRGPLPAQPTCALAASDAVDGIGASGFVNHRSCNPKRCIRTYGVSILFVPFLLSSASGSKTCAQRDCGTLLCRFPLKVSPNKASLALGSRTHSLRAAPTERARKGDEMNVLSPEDRR